MNDLPRRGRELALPTAEEAALAQETSRKLAAVLNGQDPVSVRFGAAPKETETIELPASAVRLLLDILEQMARGSAVTLMPVHAELTTQQAADLLGVSRTHLVQLLDEGKIAHRKVGTHRRIRAEDTLKYRRETERKRREALDELTAYDQELGFQ
jgi:excisionase family DNA binding protein